MKKLLALSLFVLSLSAMAEVKTCNLVAAVPLCGGEESTACVTATPNTNMGVCVSADDMNDLVSGTTCDLAAAELLCGGSKSHECFTFPNERFGVCVRSEK